MRPRSSRTTLSVNAVPLATSVGLQTAYLDAVDELLETKREAPASGLQLKILRTSASNRWRSSNDRRIIEMSIRRSAMVGLGGWVFVVVGTWSAMLAKYETCAPHRENTYT